jgi:hypothetical protein
MMFKGFVFSVLVMVGSLLYGDSTPKLIVRVPVDIDAIPEHTLKDSRGNWVLNSASLHCYFYHDDTYLGGKFIRIGTPPINKVIALDLSVIDDPQGDVPIGKIVDINKYECKVFYGTDTTDSMHHSVPASSLQSSIISKNQTSVSGEVNLSW